MPLLLNSLISYVLHHPPATQLLRFCALLFALLLCSLLLSNRAAAETTKPDGTASASAAPATVPAATKPQVRLHTNRGDIIIELWPDKSPISVENFLKYVDDGFYAGTLFHRVLDNTLIQGGGYNKYLQLKPTRDPIVNESKNRLKHKRGTVAMARQLKPNSATAQFFINVRLNSQLNYRVGQSGYAVFGQVIQGMDIVDAIAQERTGTLGSFSDVPLNLIIIESATRVAPGAPAP